MLWRAALTALGEGKTSDDLSLAQVGDIRCQGIFHVPAFVDVLHDVFGAAFLPECVRTLVIASVWNVVAASDRATCPERLRAVVHEAIALHEITKYREKKAIRWET